MDQVALGLRLRLGVLLLQALRMIPMKRLSTQKVVMMMKGMKKNSA